jgi:uncharacterized RDD family membrane protein YckC
MIRAAMAVATAGTTRFERAEFAREARVARLAALVLDVIVFGFITGIVNGVYGVTEVTSGYIGPNGGFQTTSTAVAWPWLTLLGLVYFSVFEAMFGATPGKQLMRLKVVCRHDRPLDVRAVIIRNLLKPIDFLPILYLLGGFLVLVTPAAQRLGDLAAGTTVVHRHHALEPGATRSSGRTARRVLAGAIAAAALFTIAFDYFGRPPLVIQGNFNERLGFGSDATSYSLGSPTWGFGTVTYPLTLHRGSQTCSGSIELVWSFLGWNEGQMSYDCSAS